MHPSDLRLRMFLYDGSLLLLLREQFCAFGTKLLKLGVGLIFALQETVKYLRVGFFRSDDLCRSDGRGVFG